MQVRPQADLYQLLAYCTVLDLPRGHLVYAKGEEESHDHVVQNAGVRIVAHTLDLDAQPTSVLRNVSRLVYEMRSAGALT